MSYQGSVKHKKTQHEWYLKHKKKARENVRRRRQEYREWLIEIKCGLACTECGNDNKIVLDYHHKDYSTKEGTIANMVNEMQPKKKILKEIKKCIVLCSNCHRILHHKKKTGL